MGKKDVKSCVTQDCQIQVPTTARSIAAPKIKTCQSEQKDRSTRSNFNTKDPWSRSHCHRSLDFSELSEDGPWQYGIRWNTKPRMRTFILYALLAAWNEHMYMHIYIYTYVYIYIHLFIDSFIHFCLCIYLFVCTCKIKTMCIYKYNIWYDMIYIYIFHIQRKFKDRPCDYKKSSKRQLANMTGRDSMSGFLPGTTRLGVVCLSIDLPSNGCNRSSA